MFYVYVKGEYDSEEIKVQKEKSSQYLKLNTSILVCEYTDMTDATDSCSLRFEPTKPKYNQLVGKSGSPRILRKSDYLVISDLNILGDTYEQIAKELRFLADNDIQFLVPDLENTFGNLLSYNSSIGQKNAGIIATLTHLANCHKNKSKKIGRPKVQLPQNWEEVYRSVYIDKQMNIDEALQQLGIKRTKFFEFKKEYEEKLSEGNNY